MKTYKAKTLKAAFAQAKLELGDYRATFYHLVKINGVCTLTVGIEEQ